MSFAAPTTPARSTRSGSALAPKSPYTPAMTPRNASLQLAGAQRIASIQRSGRRGGTAPAAVLSAGAPSTPLASSTRANSLYSFTDDKDATLVPASPFEKPIFKKFASDCNTVNSGAGAAAAAGSENMMVKVDLLDLEEWEKKIKGLLTQKAEMEKDRVAMIKEVEGLKEDNRSCREQIRVMTIDIANLKARIDIAEETKAQVIRDKTSLVAEKTQILSDHKAMKIRHDKMELELQKEKLMHNRDATLKLPKVAKVTDSSVASSSSAVAPAPSGLSQKEKLKAQVDAERVIALTEEAAAEDKQLAALQRQVQQLQQQQQSKPVIVAASPLAGSAAVAQLNAQMDEVKKLNEALRLELADARNQAAAAAAAVPKSITAGNAAAQLDQKDKLIAALKEEMTRLAGELEDERTKQFALMDECEAIVTKVEGIQQETEEAKMELESKVDELRNNLQEKELAALEEKIIASKQQQQYMSEISQLRMRIEELEAFKPTGMGFLDESLLSAINSDDDDDDSIIAFHTSAQTSGPAQKVRRTNVKSTPAATALSSAASSMVSGDVHLAVTSYRPLVKHSDDLVFAEGDTIIVTSKASGEWWRGCKVLENGSTSTEGRFKPSNVRAKRGAVDN